MQHCCHRKITSESYTSVGHNYQHFPSIWVMNPIILIAERIKERPAIMHTKCYLTLIWQSLLIELGTSWSLRNELQQAYRFPCISLTATTNNSKNQQKGNCKVMCGVTLFFLWQMWEMIGISHFYKNIHVINTLLNQMYQFNL